MCLLCLFVAIRSFGIMMAAVRVGIDGLHLFGNYSGIQRSLACLVGAMRATFPTDEGFLHVPRDFPRPPDANGDGGLTIRRPFFPDPCRSTRPSRPTFPLHRNPHPTTRDLTP